MAIWPVPLGSYRALFRDGAFALFRSTPDVWQGLSKFKDEPDPWFFPRGCRTVVDDVYVFAFIGNGQWSGDAKAWRSDLGDFGLEVSLGKTYANHGRGIRPGAEPGTFELTWLDEDRVTRCVAIWDRDGALGPVQRVRIADELAPALSPPADGFVAWTEPAPNYTNDPSTIRTVRGRLVGRPCLSLGGKFVIADDCEAPAGVDRVIAHDGREWHAVRGKKGEPWNSNSVQSQIDANGTGGLYGDGDDLFVSYADWIKRPLALVDVGAPDPLDDVPNLGGRPFSIVAHVDHAEAMEHPPYGNVVMPNGAPADYVEAETRPMVESLSDIPAAKWDGVFVHFSGGPDDVFPAMEAAWARANGKPHNRVKFYIDNANPSDELIAEIGSVLEDGDVCQPQFYRPKNVLDLPYAAWLLDQAARWRKRLQQGVWFMPYLSGYRRGQGADAWLSTREVVNGLVQAFRAAVQTTWRDQPIAPWDGVAIFGFKRADYEPAIEPYVQRLQQTAGGPVLYVPPVAPPVEPPVTETPDQAIERLTHDCFSTLMQSGMSWREAMQRARVAVVIFDEERHRIPTPYEVDVVDNSMRVPQPNNPDDSKRDPETEWSEAEARAWARNRPAA